jgi:hypothetical protein
MNQFQIIMTDSIFILSLIVQHAGRTMEKIASQKGDETVRKIHHVITRIASHGMCLAPRCVIIKYKGINIKN